jgi:GNAT superfamily N-acetyltransferase
VSLWHETHVWRIGSGGFIGSVSVIPVPSAEVLGAVKKRRPLMFLTYLFVHPLRRGRGWGGELVAAATAWADAEGIDLWLYARPYGHARGRRTVEQLVAFYRAHGFRPIEGAGHRNEMVRRCRSPKTKPR